MELQVSREIAASSEQVWALITDLDGSPRLLSAVTGVERLDGPAFGVGTGWRETRVMLGREATEEMEVTAVDEGRRYEVLADAGSTDYRSVMAVRPLGEDRCRLSMSFAAASSSVLGRLAAATVGRLFQKATRKMLEQDLADIATTAEASQGA
jgi:carbon monoxide dehydrogenase subunit G